jgi:hypothetical protein
VKTKILVMASATVLLWAAFGLAQHGDTIRLDIPFQFTVGGTVLPAGEYNFIIDALGTAIRVVGINPGNYAETLVITRLGAETHTSNDNLVVFDEIENTHAFSELWVSGIDGFLVNIPKAKHTHRTIKGTKK